MSLVPNLTQHLTDCFAKLFAYVLWFRQGAFEKQLPYEDVRGEILRLMKLSELYVNNGFCPMEDYDQARYAVCAWIDESISASEWKYKARWRPELLQRLFYQSADGGEQFFARLKNLEPHQQGIREVYYLCLVLGFKGRYCDPDDRYALDGLKERHLKLLFNSVSELPSLAMLEKNILFPESYSPHAHEPAPKPRRTRSTWITTMTAPAIVCAMLFLLYRITLYNLGETILKVVRS